MGLLTFRGGGLQEITFVDSAGNTLFSKSIIQLQQDINGGYVNVEIQFDNNIDVSTYNGLESNYYNNIFASSGFNRPSNETIQILNTIPYLDTFILSLEYFLNNDFLDLEEVLEIKNKIYNDLRKINLEYQIAVFNKYTIEGEISQVETRIDNFCEELAIGAQKDYVDINFELERIFLQTGGGQLSEGFYENDPFTLSDLFNIPMPNSMPQVTYEDLMANGFMFYPVSEEIYYSYFTSDEFGGTLWDGTAPLNNRTYYAYEVLGTTYFLVSSSFTSNYPYNIKFTSPYYNTLNNYIAIFNSNTEVIEIDETTDSITWDPNSFTNDLHVKYYLSSNIVPENNFNTSTSEVKIEYGDYKKRWKNYQSDYGDDSLPTYFENLPDDITGPERLFFIPKPNPVSSQATSYYYEKEDIGIALESWYQFGEYASLNYQSKFVSGVRYSRLVSDSILINAQYSNTFKIYIDGAKDENSTYTPWFPLSTPAYTLQAFIQTPSQLGTNSARKIVNFYRPSGKGYYLPSDASFNIGSYTGMYFTIFIPLSQGYSDYSFQNYFSNKELGEFSYINVSNSARYEYYPTPFMIDGTDKSALPVEGQIRWLNSNTIYTYTPSLNTFQYSYHILNVDTNILAEESQIQKIWMIFKSYKNSNYSR